MAATGRYTTEHSRRRDVPADPAARVRAILSVGDDALDYSAAKLAFDQLVDPAAAPSTTMAQLDRMVQEVRRLAGPAATPDTTFGALRRLIYEAGPWNDGRQFAYDHTDPDGYHIPNKLIANYLATRRGNCISMPALLVILGDQLGLDVALAAAPCHLFLRYHDERQQVFNIEATSGGHPAREQWFRTNLPMTDRAIASGIYMRSFSKREGVAALAGIVMEHLFEQGRFDETLAVADVIRRHAPLNIQAITYQACASGALFRTEFVERYSAPALVPPRLRSRSKALAQRGESAFRLAEALGWGAVA